MGTPDFTFHHGGVSVPDLEAAIGWYGDMLGFEEERRFFIDKANAHVAFVRKGPLRFDMNNRPRPGRRQRHPDVQFWLTFLTQRAPISARRGARKRQASRR